MRIDTRHAWVEVAAVTTLAAVLRLTTLGLQSYEFDEAWTLKVIGGSFTDMLHGVARFESTPPVYYVLAWAWAHVFGTSETGLRFLSGIAGVAIVPVVYATGRALLSRRVALIAAAIVATNPYLVFYSQEARSYALFALLSTLGLLCCVRAMQDPNGRTFALWSAVSVGAFATHYFAFFPWAGQVVALAVFGAPRRLLASSSAAAAAAFLPLLVLAKHQAGAGHVDWIGAVSLTQRLRVTIETYLFGATFRGTLPHAVLAACGFFAVVIAGALVIAAALLIRRAAPDERRAAAIPGLIAVVSITIPLVGALGPADYFLHKNLIPVLPMLALVVAAGLGCRRSGRIGIAAATALLLVGASLTVMSFAVPSLRRPDVRLASRQLGPPMRERIVVFVPRWQLLLEHYQGGLRSVPAGGARVSEIDVFTSSETLPAGTVPSEFHLARVQHGNPFIVYTFRSRRPSTVGPKTVGTHTFTESGLQPIALLQAPR